MIGGETDQGIKTTEANTAAYNPEFPVTLEFGQYPPEVSPAFADTDPRTKEEHHIEVPQRGRPVPVPTFEAHGSIKDEGCAEEHSSDQAEKHQAEHCDLCV